MPSAPPRGASDSLVLRHHGTETAVARGGLQCRVRLVQTRTCLQGMLRQFAAACTFLKADLLVNLQGRDVGLLSAGRSRSGDNGSKAAFDIAGMASGSG